MYLELIENDDYRTLPGGIFNKGFVKSYAKYVGIDEQEALQDYARIVAGSEEEAEPQKTYRPEVLTDDRTTSSMIPTVIFAVIILGLMTWGILALVNYIQENQNRPAAANTNNNPAANNNAAPANQPAPASTDAPAMGAIKVEFKTTGEDIAFSANMDGKNSFPTATLAVPVVFEPKQSLEFSYLKLKAAVARMTINGKDIPLPTEATDARGKYIQVKITAETLPQLWQSGTGTVTTYTPAAANSNTNANTNTTPSTVTPTSSTPPPRPTVATTPKPVTSPGANTAAPKPVTSPTAPPRPATSPRTGGPTMAAPAKTP